MYDLVCSSCSIPYLSEPELRHNERYQHCRLFDAIRLFHWKFEKPNAILHWADAVCKLLPPQQHQPVVSHSISHIKSSCTHHHTRSNTFDSFQSHSFPQSILYSLRSPQCSCCCYLELLLRFWTRPKAKREITFTESSFSVSKQLRCDSTAHFKNLQPRATSSILVQLLPKQSKFQNTRPSTLTNGLQVNTFGTNLVNRRSHGF
jgi:hypothetical protein